jgi:hypothetical protein
VANIPIGNSQTPGVAKYNYLQGVGLNANNELQISLPSESEIKSGANGVRRPITPTNQHASTFYGLAKAAGDTTQSASSNAVGTYTEEAKTAIQKMLGIYEAPWELIREDTGTNATSGNIDITVDSNGEAFELTDIRLLFNTPKQDTDAVVGNYGRVRCYFSDSSADIVYIGSYTQASQATGRTSAVQIVQKDGMIERSMWKNNTDNGERAPVSIIYYAPYTNGTVLWQLGAKTYRKISIEAVTGTWNYTLYGKRKWT